MPFLNSRVLDNGLTVLDTEADKLYLCSQEPTTFAEATSTYALGNKDSISIGAPADRSPSGRQVTVAAIVAGAPGNITASGTATHYAIVDSVNSRLLATAALTASQVVTNGNTFTTASFTIGISGPS